MKAWPFPGESPVVRARKMALAYRNVAQQLQADHDRLVELFGRIDPRILDWIDDEETRKLLKNLDKNPDLVGELDKRFREWGETWHAEVVVQYTDDDEVDAKEASKLIHVSANTINRARMRGRITGTFKKKTGDNMGRWYYVVADVYKLSTELRGRGWRRTEATDTVPSSGSSDAE